MGWGTTYTAYASRINKVSAKYREAEAEEAINTMRNELIALACLPPSPIVDGEGNHVAPHEWLPQRVEELVQAITEEAVTMCRCVDIQQDSEARSDE